MQHNQVLKHKGIIVKQEKEGMILTYRGSIINNIDEYLYCVIVSNNNKVYKYDIKYARELVKQYSKDCGDSDGMRKRILLFFDSKLDNYKIEKDIFDNLINKFEDAIKDNKENKKIIFSKMMKTLILDNKTSDAIDMFISFTINRYKDIYNNVHKVYNSKIYGRDIELSNQYKARINTEELITLINRIFTDCHEVIPLSSKQKQSKKGTYSYKYICFKDTNKEIGIDTWLYGNYILPNMKMDDKYRNKDLYNKYMYINDGLKQYAKKIKWNNNDTSISIDIGAIRKYLIARMYNQETNTILLSNSPNTSNERLTKSFKEEFISSMQLYCSYAFFTYSQFIDFDQTNSTQNDFTQIKNDNIIYKNINNIKNKALYVLNYHEDMAQEKFTNNMKCFKNIITTLRNTTFHYRSGTTHLNCQIGKEEEKEAVLESYLCDIKEYHRQLFIRMNSNELYKIRVCGKVMDSKEYINKINASLLNAVKFIGDYSAPRFKSIQPFISYYEDFVKESEEQQQALYYYFLIQYKDYIANHISTVLEGIGDKYIDQYQKQVEKENKKFNKGKVKKGFSNQLLNFIQDINEEKLTLAQLKVAIQKRIHQIETDLYIDKNIAQKQKDKAKKLLLQWNTYEKLYIGTEFNKFVKDNNLDDIMYDREIVKEYSCQETINNTPILNDMTIAFYGLCKFLDRKHIAMIINDLYRYYVKLNEVNELDDTTSKSIKETIKELTKLKLLKDNMEINENSYKQSIIIENYVTTNFNNTYLTDLNNMEVAKALRRVEKIYHYGYLLSSDYKLDCIDEVKQPEEAIAYIANMTTRSSIDIKDIRKKEESLLKIQQYQNYINYIYGKPIIDMYYLLTEIQSRLLRTLYLIEKDVKNMVYHYTKEVIDIERENGGITRERHKRWKRLESIDQLYDVLLAIECSNHVIKEGNKYKFLLDYCSKELKQVVNQLSLSSKMNINFFNDTRDIISHFTYINKEADMLKEKSVIIGGLFENQDTDSLITLIYHMLKYDLKKQKSFLLAIKNIFKKHKYDIDFTIEDNKVLVKYEGVRSQYKELPNIKKRLYYHNQETVMYINQVLIHYKITK